MSQELADNAVLEEAGKLAPIAGFTSEFVVDIATGQSKEKATARAIGSTAGALAGEAAGGAVCGIEVVATAGSGALICGVLVWGGGVAGGILGGYAGGFIASQAGGLGDDLAQWIEAHLP